MRNLLFLFVAPALAACATAPQPVAQSAEAEAKLQQLLAGRVAGEPVSCLPHWRRDDMTIIDDDTILFESGGTIYRNELRGSCANLSSGFYSLVTRSTSPTLCSGEIAQVVDVSTGTMIGGCTIGEFIPYVRS